MTISVSRCLKELLVTIAPIIVKTSTKNALSCFCKKYIIKNKVMKANAPEKIYLEPSLDSIWGMAERSCESEVEYTRTDAFIEKAVEYITTHIPDMHTFGVSAKMDECIIEDFKNYLKGE